MVRDGAAHLLTMRVLRRPTSAVLILRSLRSERLEGWPGKDSSPSQRFLNDYLKWHATSWPGALSFSGGTSRLQTSWASGQRVWKWQPDGGLIGLGTSPLRRTRLRFTEGSGIGTADSSASV